MKNVYTYDARIQIPNDCINQVIGFYTEQNDEGYYSYVHKTLIGLEDILHNEIKGPFEHEATQYQILHFADGSSIIRKNLDIDLYDGHCYYEWEADFKNHEIIPGTEKYKDGERI